MAKGRQEWAAGVFIYDHLRNAVLGVSRDKPITRFVGVDWGLPGGWGEKGEMPEDTARRELHEETRLVGRRLQYALTVPPEITGNVPYHVFMPVDRPVGRYPNPTIVNPEKLFVRWIEAHRMVEVHDETRTVAESNRYILYALLGVDYPLIDAWGASYVGGPWKYLRT